MILVFKILFLLLCLFLEGLPEPPEVTASGYSSLSCFSDPLSLVSVSVSNLVVKAFTAVRLLGSSCLRHHFLTQARRYYYAGIMLCGNVMCSWALGVRASCRADASGANKVHLSTPPTSLVLVAATCFSLPCRQIAW